MFSIITGGIDLSIGCTFAITGISVAWCCVSGVNPWLAILIGILIGVLLGAFNGFLVNKLKLQPFIATLGTQSLYRGIAYVVTGGRPVTGVPDSFRNIFNGEMIAGIRFYIIVMILIFILAYLILGKTRTGRLSVRGGRQRGSGQTFRCKRSKDQIHRLHCLQRLCGGSRPGYAGQPGFRGAHCGKRI